MPGPCIQIESKNGPCGFENPLLGLYHQQKSDTLAFGFVCIGRLWPYLADLATPDIEFEAHGALSRTSSWPIHDARYSVGTLRPPLSFKSQSDKTYCALYVGLTRVPMLFHMFPAHCPSGAHDHCIVCIVGFHESARPVRFTITLQRQRLYPQCISIRHSIGLANTNAHDLS